MKKVSKKIAITVLMLSGATTYPVEGKQMKLPQAPTSLEQYNEVAVVYDTDLSDLFNKLNPQERIFIYYLWRASLPGNHIAADQIHRYSRALFNLFFDLYQDKDKLLKNENLTSLYNVSEFIQQLKTYLIYLWTNHGQYFQRESSDEKRTPGRLGLELLTKQNLTSACKALGYSNGTELITNLESFIFDHSFERTTTVPNSINESAVNFYDPAFTDEDFNRLTPEQRTKLNAYFSLNTNEGIRTLIMTPYAINGRYSQELSVAHAWLSRARDYAKEHPEYFDEHTVKGLDYLLNYLVDGDEHWFKLHSIEWTKSKNKVDYNFGFIETYQDPKSYRGLFQAEATIKSFDLTKLNNILPSLEKELPFPPTFKRDNLEKGLCSIPNASINNKVFGVGGLGPLFITAAYCLPNYNEIRSEHGSKQIIYPAQKGIEQLLNPNLSRKLFMLKKDAEWSEHNDPDQKLGRDIWDVQCILHETLGHGSGKLATHTFQEGEELSINGETYAIGDTIQVTSENLPEFLAGYESTVEELRAEIIALYVSINHLDDLMNADLLIDWKDKVSDEFLVGKLILGMAETGLRRYIQQSDSATEISGDHARANCTIMNYLVDHGALALREEIVAIEKKQHTIVGLEIVDLEQAKEKIKELMVLVQHIKSTGDGKQARELIEHYGRPLRYPQYLKILKENRKAVVNNIKTTCVLSPHFAPYIDKAGNITDIHATWPKDIIDQIETYESLTLLTI